MAKKVLVGFVGLPRTYKRTYESIFEKMIEPAMEKGYEFDIYIHTEYTDDEVKNEVFNTYNKHGQVREIIDFKVSRSIVLQQTQLRINDLLKRIDINQYTYVIFIRMDANLLAPVNLDEYKNKFSTLTGHFTRESLFHERDWDLFFISDIKPFYLFMHAYTIFCKKVSGCDDMVIPKHPAYAEEWKLYEETIETKDYSFSEIERLCSTHQIRSCLLGQYNHYKSLQTDFNIYIDLFRAVECLVINGCEFELSNVKNILIHVLR